MHPLDFALAKFQKLARVRRVPRSDIALIVEGQSRLCPLIGRPFPTNLLTLFTNYGGFSMDAVLPSKLGRLYFQETLGFFPKHPLWDFEVVTEMFKGFIPERFLPIARGEGNLFLLDVQGGGVYYFVYDTQVTMPLVPSLEEFIEILEPLQEGERPDEWTPGFVFRGNLGSTRTRPPHPRRHSRTDGLLVSMQENGKPFGEILFFEGKRYCSPPDLADHSGMQIAFGPVHYGAAWDDLEDYKDSLDLMGSAYDEPQTTAMLSPDEAREKAKTMTPF